jgi:DNA repair protein RecO (recombination protein O)
MLEKYQGIILRLSHWKENSYIGSVFTLSEGKLSFIIPAALSNKGQKSHSSLQVGYIIDFIGYVKANRSIQKLTESSLHYIYSAIPYDPVLFLYISLALEVVEKSTKEQDPSEKIYALLKNYLIALDKGEKGAYYLTLSFLINLTRQLGFYPFLQVENPQGPIKFALAEGKFINDYQMNSEGARYLYQYISRALNNNPSSELQIPKHVRYTILSLLLEYYKIHIENFGSINSLPIFLQIFS